MPYHAKQVLKPRIPQPNGSDPYTELESSVNQQAGKPALRDPPSLHEGQWYLAALNSKLDGIRIARLKWAAIAGR